MQFAAVVEQFKTFSARDHKTMDPRDRNTMVSVYTLCKQLEIEFAPEFKDQLEIALANRVSRMSGKPLLMRDINTVIKTHLGFEDAEYSTVYGPINSQLYIPSL